MRTVKTVALVLLAVSQTVGVAYAQCPGEPAAPAAYDPVADMKYTFQIGAPDPILREAQIALQQQGYYTGPIDGVISPAVRSAVWRFQRANGLDHTGSLDRFTIIALGVGGAPVYASPPSFEGGEMTTAPVEIQAP
jgi:peptidoglycan hydrolase-like protein with peptidoglycan-binding domain